MQDIDPFERGAMFACGAFLGTVLALAACLGFAACEPLATGVATLASALSGGAIARVGCAALLRAGDASGGL